MLGVVASYVLYCRVAEDSLHLSVDFRRPVRRTSRGSELSQVRFLFLSKIINDYIFVINIITESLFGKKNSLNFVLRGRIDAGLVAGRRSCSVTQVLSCGGKCDAGVAGVWGAWSKGGDRARSIAS